MITVQASDYQEAQEIARHLNEPYTIVIEPSTVRGYYTTLSTALEYVDKLDKEVQR